MRIQSIVAILVITSAMMATTITAILALSSTLIPSTAQAVSHGEHRVAELGSRLPIADILSSQLLSGTSDGAVKGSDQATDHIETHIAKRVAPQNTILK